MPDLKSHPTAIVLVKDKGDARGSVDISRAVFRCARFVSIYLDYDIHKSSHAYRKFLTFASGREAEDLLEGETSLWEKICEALQSEYFGRVWVQQEMSLARQLALQCRRTPMPIKCLFYFLDAWYRLDYRQFDGDLKVDAENPLLQPPNFGFLNILRGFNNPFTEKPLDLIELLFMSVRFKCTDERDRVYGVMFLSHNWRRGYLSANYSLTVSDVFQEAMVSYLHNFRSISFLQYANFSYEKYENIRDRTPSWVPDWRKKPVTLVFDSEVPEIGRSGNHPLVARVFENTLYTTGIRIMKIQKYYGNMLGHDELLSIPIQEFWIMFNDIVKNATHPIDLATRSRRLFRLLTDRGKESALNSDDGYHNRAFETFISFFSSMSNSAADDVLPPSSNSLNLLRFSLRDSGIRGNEEHLLIFRLLNWFGINYFGLLMPFISQTGSIGLAPHHTQPDDELWLMPTCKCPIVLRPHNGKHIVLGNAWLDNESIWEPCGGMRDFLTEGDEFGSYKVEPVWLE